MRILYIMSSYNLYGGTPKKTLDLMKHFKDNSVLYVYQNEFSELKSEFEATGGRIYEGFHGRNIILHIKELLSIIDIEKIDVVQTQFSMGETLGCLVKMFRPKVKLVVAFVGPFKPLNIKKFLLSIFYSKVDSFVYITEYVKREKMKQFPILHSKNGIIIFNGTEKRIDNGKQIVKFKKNSLFDIAGLVDWKNIQILIEAINIIVNIRQRNDIFLYIAGDGPMRQELETLIEKYRLENFIFLLGYQSNIGGLLNNCDVFVHPSYAEGFGIVIPEAMLAGKPIIVSNAGALPELVENNVSGIIVEPNDAGQWADAILKIIDNPQLAGKLSYNGKLRAEKEFYVQKFTKNYEYFYKSLLEKQV